MNNFATWAKEAVFYHIYPLGLCGAGNENTFKSPPGDCFIQLHNWIPHIKSMGCNALYLGPVFESSKHGYDTADYFNVDRRLGTNGDLKAFSEYLHNEGISLVLDAVFNHVGRDFWAFLDLKKNNRESRFIDWFCSVDFNGHSIYGDMFTYEGWNGNYDLVKLNLKNGEVRAHLLGAVATWMNDYRIDGLRLDVAEILDESFIIELKQFCKSIRPDFWLMGEIIHGNYNRLVNDDLLDSVTNYEVYKGMYSSHNDANYFEIAYSLNRQFGEDGIYRGLNLYNFADNHDVNRVASALKNSNHLFTLYTLLFTIPGIPSLYYGSEWGQVGVRSANDDKLLRPKLHLIADAKAPPIYEHIKRLSFFKRTIAVLSNGNYRQLFVSHQLFVFIRFSEDTEVIVCVNSAVHPASVQVALSGADGAQFIDQFDFDFITVLQNEILNIGQIPACGSRLLLKVKKHLTN
jgi:cyclomaltodextrinase